MLKIWNDHKLWDSQSKDAASPFPSFAGFQSPLSQSSFQAKKICLPQIPADRCSAPSILSHPALVCGLPLSPPSSSPSSLSWSDPLCTPLINTGSECIFFNTYFSGTTWRRLESPPTLTLSFFSVDEKMCPNVPRDREKDNLHHILLLIRLWRYAIHASKNSLPLTFGLQPSPSSAPWKCFRCPPSLFMLSN